MGSRLASFAGLLLFAGMAALCAYGSVASGIFTQRLWRPDLGSNLPMAAVLVAGVAIVVLASHKLRLPMACVAGAAGLAMAASFAGVGPVAVTLLVLMAAFCAGRNVLPADDQPSLESIAIATALGLAFLSFAIALLSFLPYNNPATYLAVVLGPFLYRPVAHWEALRTALRNAWSAPAAGAWERILGGTICLALAIQLIAVLQPEVGSDALAMHLQVLDQLRSAGRFPYDVEQFAWSVMPMGVDWVYALGGMLSGEAAARLLNFSAELLLLALLRSYVAAACGSRAGLLAVLLYASTPLLYLESTSLYVENLWTLWLIASLVCAEKYARMERTHWVVAAGILLGAAVSAKVITVLAAPLFLATAWMMARRGLAVRGVLILAGLALVFGVLPYANAWLRTGNPVFPFMNQVFKSPFFVPLAFNNPLYNNSVDWRTLYDVTFNSGGYLEGRGGAIGLLWMCVLPATCILAWKAGRRWVALLVLALLFMAGVFAFQSYLRYVLPGFVILAAVVAASAKAIGDDAGWKQGVVASIFAMGGLIGLYLYPSASWYYPSLALPPFAGNQASFFKNGYDERLLPGLIDGHGFNRVLWLGRPLYSGGRARITVVNWTSPDSNVAYRELASIEDTKKWIADSGFDAIVLATNNKACDRDFFCEFLARHTSPVFTSGLVSLHAVKPSISFGDELLANPGFDGGTSGWSGTGVYNADTNSVHVDNRGAFRQRVPVMGGRQYLLGVTARCLSVPAQYRLQVNWMAGNRMLTNHVRAPTCGHASRLEEDIVRAPATATHAIVFAGGHKQGVPVDIEAVSFQQ